MHVIESKGPLHEFVGRRNELFDAKLVSEFSACASDVDRFRIVSATLAKHRKIEPLTLVKSQDSEKNLNYALEVKQKGNNCFKNNSWLDAMKFYTLSYLHTPQEKSESENLLEHFPVEERN